MHTEIRIITLVVVVVKRRCCVSRAQEKWNKLGQKSKEPAIILEEGMIWKWSDVINEGDNKIGCTIEKRREGGPWV